MRWYVSRNGETVGPVEETTLVEQVRAGLHDGMVRDEAGGPWTPIEQSPFASVITASRAQAAAALLAQKNARQAPWVVGGVVVLGGFLLFAMCSSKDDRADELQSPDPVIRAMAERARTPVPTPDAEAEGARKAIASEWAKYDALTVRSKEALFAALESSLRVASNAPEASAPTIDAEVRASSRERMARLIRPEASAAGPGRAVLVPSSDQAQCIVWGSMWTNKTDTVESLILLGFTQIQCADRTWKIDGATIKSAGIVTNGGVMVFESPTAYDEAANCERTFQPGNAEAEAQARNFENPEKALDQLRALCFMGAVGHAKFLQVGTSVQVLKRLARTAKVKVLTGTETGHVTYAASESVAE